jgi:hypothetical protein
MTKSRIRVAVLILVMAAGTVHLGLPRLTSQSAYAQASSSLVLVSYTGVLNIDQKKLTKTYEIDGEVKNNSGRDITNLSGKVTLYWRGASIANDTLIFPTKEVKAGENVPFTTYTSDLNYLLDVDDAKFTFDGQATDASIYVPPLSFAASNVEQGSLRGVTAKITNNGPESVEDARAIMSFYDAQGKIVSSSERQIFYRQSYDKDKPLPLMNAGLTVSTRFGGPYPYTGPLTYKVLFRGKFTTKQSQVVQVTNVSLRDRQYGYKVATGNLTNPSDKAISQVYLHVTQLDGSGKVIYEDHELFANKNSYGYREFPIPLGPKETKPFEVDDIYPQSGFANVDILAISYDQFEGPPIQATPLPTIQAPPPPSGFAHPAFQNTWNRTDQPVAGGQIKRSWYWGPQPNSGPAMEDYAEGAGGKRLVQYFDKSRMEINNPAGDPNSKFFVTNGLLTVELISGKMQTGNATYAARWPANIPLASDPDDPSAPTYKSFLPVANTPAGDHPADSRIGQPATATISRDGTVGQDPSKASYSGVNVAYYDRPPSTTFHRPSGTS